MTWKAPAPRSRRQSVRIRRAVLTHERNVAGLHSGLCTSTQRRPGREWRSSPGVLPTTANAGGGHILAVMDDRDQQGRPDSSQSAARRRRDEDLASRRAGQGPEWQARQLQVRNPLLRVLARFLGVRTRDRAWRVGAAGERKVGRKLDRLGRRGWHVLHGVELGRGGDIDHLLIGRLGVFAVNTKHHPGARVTVGRSVVFVRGRQQPYVAKALREASRVRRALSAATGRPVNVEPLVVIHGHAHISGWVRNHPGGVRILPSRAVTWWLRMPARSVLSAAEAEALYAIARSPRTWRSA